MSELRPSIDSIFISDFVAKDEIRDSEKQSSQSVILQVHKDNSRLLTGVINRATTQKNIIRDLTRELSALAIYLHASQRLRFSRCTNGDGGKAQFVFLDPECLGDQLELEFENGAQVAANCLFASQKYLRRKMTEALNLNNRNTEYADYKR
jgi:hypothetical protein